MSFMDPILDGVDTLLAWLATSLKQTTASYCDLETADSRYNLVTHDGSLLSILKIDGVATLVGDAEFERINRGLNTSLQSAMSRPGQAIQVLFNYEKESVEQQIEHIFRPSVQTANELGLQLDDFFKEKNHFLANYCAKEAVYWVLITRTSHLSQEQLRRAQKEQQRRLKAKKIPPFKDVQNPTIVLAELRETHDSFVRATLQDLVAVNVYASVLDVHEALRHVRQAVDSEFTDEKWRPLLPGDKIPLRAPKTNKRDDVSNLLWPPLSRQLLPRDAENLDLRTVRIGDRVYAPQTIELFPRDVKPFIDLLRRTLPTKIPWRIAFLIESEGLKLLKFKSFLASVLSFSSAYNHLIADATKMLRDVEINTDDPVVKLRVAMVTWAPGTDLSLLRSRAAQLAKAVEGWGTCEVSEVSGDPFGGVVSSMLGMTSQNVATASIAPLSEVIYMLPTTRPASLWETGGLLFRTPDGKLWPYQPGSSQQTTWIDLIYARPGSGKSVLSNAINLALCLSPGIKRLPRISIIDIGPSSSGLISLLKEALPVQQQHLVAYHRLRMLPEYAINPFDLPLGRRFPTPQERAFLINFLTLLATPVGAYRAYDAIADLVGLVVDELYKSLSEKGNPHVYTPNLEPLIDGILEEIGFVSDTHTSWWEVTDSLFVAGFVHEAMLAQRYAVPLVADAASICHSQVIEDLYGEIVVATGEKIIDAFSRMISGAVREYPILSRITQFDLGDARVVVLDLDEIAKTGGDVADRQTAVMYMLARYVTARDFYLTEESLTDISEQYQNYHKVRMTEMREDHKRLVYDEFHRTSKSKAVRDQIIVDMREGRKWKVQVCLLSQSVEDFDPIMVEFATSIYVMDAGPAQAVKKTAEIFGLSDTAQLGLITRVHGPREGGATFLAQFSTKIGINTQLLTLTLGPIELWALSTTADDVYLRNSLYYRLGSREARRVLATLFPTGSAMSLIERRLARERETQGHLVEVSSASVLETLIEEIMAEYKQNPQFKALPA